MKVYSYQDLSVWQKGMELAEAIYGIVKILPVEERYGLSDQMQRAAISIPSNIAEGQARRNNKEFSHFLRIALGSKSEIETQLLLCKRLQFAPPSTNSESFASSRGSRENAVCLAEKNTWPMMKKSNNFSNIISMIIFSFLLP